MTKDVVKSLTGGILITETTRRDESGDEVTKIAELKKENIQKIRAFFYDGEIHTKSELSELSGISLAGVTNILQYLLETEEILLTGKADSTGGRKSKQYVLNSSYKTIATMILQKKPEIYELTVSLRNLANEELFTQKVTSTQGDLSFFNYGLEILMSQPNSFSFLAISIPGVCHKGMIRECDYEGLQNTDLGKQIKEKTNVPFVIENDVNVACIGFSYEVPEIQNLAYVYQPKTDYTGCGFLINGRLFNGFTHSAGELRFLPHVPEDPREILQSQLIAICAILNPEMIAYTTDFETTDSDTLLDAYPSEYQPQLVKITNLTKDIQDGLFHIGLDNILKGE